MIIKCDESWNEKILGYIGDNYEQCLLLYVDLIKYGYNHPNISVYSGVDERQEINIVFLLYHDCLHIYSADDNFDESEVLDFIMQLVPKVICCSLDTALKLEKGLLGDGYKMEKTTVMKQAKFIEGVDCSDVEGVSLNDVKEVTDFLLTEPMYSEKYTTETLLQQLTERLNDNFIQCFAIRNEEGKIIGFNSSNGEVDKLVVSGPLLIDREYRGKKLGEKLLAKLYNTEIEQGRIIYLFPIDERSIHIHQGLKGEIVGTTAKFVKKD